MWNCLFRCKILTNEKLDSKFFENKFNFRKLFNMKNYLWGELNDKKIKFKLFLIS